MTSGDILLLGFASIAVGIILVLIGLSTILWGKIEQGLKSHPVEVLDE